MHNITQTRRYMDREECKNCEADSVTTSSLHALQSTDQQKVIDIVDKLRRTSLSSIVELPQLIVCGDQSSGKSSILKAITEIPFPRKENLCTRFTTKIILRRSASSTSTITITPDKLRPKSEQAKLKSFSKAINDFSQLPDIIEEATQAIGLGVVGGINSRAFSRDVLSVKITSPARPQLTLVDLPGLIHATNKAQTETDKELILNLVKEYMKNPLSAKNDYANQIILDHCRKIDEQGRRTLGIITKPDFLREGTDNELTWIELAQNKDIYLERGWYMLKNRDEDLFFSKGRYAELPRECVGIGSLRERLSKVLLSHLIKELPSLKDEMVNKLQGTVAEIKKLGDRRNTTHKQRMVLMKISMRISDILNSATKGYYESSFFGPINMDAAVNVSENIRRFRAVIQHLNINFASNMRLRGHKYTFREQITSQHINTIASAYREFIDIVLQDATPYRLTSLYVDGALAQALSNAKEELHKILKDKARHPATYNHYFTTTIQKMRQRKHQEIIEKASKASETSIYHRNDENVYTYLNPSKLTEAMEKAIELNMDVFSSQEALDTKRAFYKDKIKYFVNTITKAVIKRHLVAPLPKIILSPIVVTQITEKEVEFIATKSSEITQQRLYLESRKSMLEKGLETFREAMGGLKR
ncbi:Dynamin family protein [Bipolaris maydis]|nr:Dynamin family protein [Bipolaris maydis]